MRAEYETCSFFSPNIYAFINSSFLEQLPDDVCLHILPHQWRTDEIEWPMYSFTIYDIFFRPAARQRDIMLDARLDLRADSEAFARRPSSCGLYLF